jgi:uridine phosphorylase
MTHVTFTGKLEGEMVSVVSTAWGAGDGDYIGGIGSPWCSSFIRVGTSGVIATQN